MSKYIINLDTGVVAFRNAYTDRQVNMKPIPDAVVDMMRTGKVSVNDVITAINAKIRESGEFDDIENYLAERAKLNVHKTTKKASSKSEALPDRSKEEISVSDLFCAQDDEKREKKSKAKKEEVFDALAGM